MISTVQPTGFAIRTDTRQAVRGEFPTRIARKAKRVPGSVGTNLQTLTTNPGAIA